VGDLQTLDPRGGRALRAEEISGNRAEGRHPGLRSVEMGQGLRRGGDSGNGIVIQRKPPLGDRRRDEGSIRPPNPLLPPSVGARIRLPDSLLMATQRNELRFFGGGL
jgi:hypothetical protein